MIQGKLASFFLSRVDALSPQLQQVRGRRETVGSLGSELVLPPTSCFLVFLFFYFFYSCFLLPLFSAFSFPSLSTHSTHQ